MKQLITLVFIATLSQSRRFFDQHLKISDLEKVKSNACKRSDHPHGGVIHLMVRCPDGSNSKEVLTEYLPDTSTQAVAPKMQHWNDLAEEALSDMQCKNGEKGQVRLEGFNNLREKRADDSKPGLVEWIAVCSDGGDSKTALSVHVPDTSTEAVAHMSWLFDEYLEEARLHVKCADSKTATIKTRVT